jgi:hypothetical protein
MGNVIQAGHYGDVCHRRTCNLLSASIFQGHMYDDSLMKLLLAAKQSLLHNPDLA